MHGMVRERITCRICNAKDIDPFLDLGLMPLPNGFLPPDKLKEQEPLYPLSVGVCRKCKLVQLTAVVEPSVMFKNYVYIPSASQTRLDNFASIVHEALTLRPATPEALAVDIGSNDGSLLLEFKKQGVKTLGVDPAENLSLVAELKGIHTLNTYFSAKTALKIRNTFGQARYITATNVVAHIDNLHDFFYGISLLLGTDSIFICEFPYLVDLLEKKLFDTIYQEHLSYFAIGPLLGVIDRYALRIISIKRTPIDGGALRIVIGKKDKPSNEENVEVRRLLMLEKKAGLNTFTTYKRFASAVRRLRKEIKTMLHAIKKKKKSIAGYGAAARGNILMNYCGVGKAEIDFIVDSTPYKQGLFTPGTHIPIYAEEEILKQRPDYVLILAWNFAEEIIKKQHAYHRSGGKFIIPVPHVKII